MEKYTDKGRCEWRESTLGKDGEELFEMTFKPKLQESDQEMGSEDRG